MAHLTLAGITADGRQLRLVSDRGAEFTLDINPALKAALRGDTTRLGQLEIQMSSSLRPREIQNRIRAGESPETVADAAGTTVQAIMPYVAPVVAERQHVAERAQRASLRRAVGEGQPSGSRVLGDTVAARLRDLEVDPTTVTWDAFRRETGRWVLTAEFSAPARSGTAKFTFDPPGNYVLSEDDHARWLVGDLVETPTTAPRDDLQLARERKLAALPEELPLGDDALGLVTAEQASPAPTSSAPTEAPADRSSERAADQAPIDPAAPVTDAGDPATGEGAQESTDEDDLAPTAEGRPDTRHRRPQKKRGRASVPSWDEIMFGGGDQ